MCIRDSFWTLELWTVFFSCKSRRLCLPCILSDPSFRPILRIAVFKVWLVPTHSVPPANVPLVGRSDLLDRSDPTSRTNQIPVSLSRSFRADVSLISDLSRYFGPGIISLICMSCMICTICTIYGIFFWAPDVRSSIFHPKHDCEEIRSRNLTNIAMR